MKKILLVFSFCSMINLLMAQNDQQKTDSVCKLVRKYFNEKNSDKVYALTGEAFKKAISEDAFASISKNNLFPLGEMKESTFENSANGVSRYKAVFSSTNLSLLLSLDKNDKIETLLFQQYQNTSARKNAKVPSTNKLATPLDKMTDDAIQPYISMQSTVGVSIGILKDGKDFFYGYGETSRGNSQLPGEHTLFEIGSITKTFTAILLANAVDKGLVKLDDPINKYLPDSIPRLQFDGTPITLKTLSNHTSGLPRMPSNFSPADNSNPYKDYYDRNLFSFLKNFKPTRKPGEQYEYSNLAVGTLGIILERVYHKPYETLISEKIWKPVCMTETKIHLTKNDTARFAKGYDENGSYSSQWDFHAFAAAGSIRSTVWDMLKYARAVMGEAPQQLKKDIELTEKVTFAKGDTKLGLGWHYIKPGTDELIFHNGQTGGYHAYLAIDKKKQVAIVILSNCALGTEQAGAAMMKWLENN